MKEFIYKVLQWALKTLWPIRQRRVMFIAYYGSQYDCNPKYLSKSLSKLEDVDIVWAFTEPEKHPDCKDGRKVRWGSVGFFVALCTSRVVVSNYRMPRWYSKRKGQVYLQTWHSSLRLKRVEADAIETLEPNYVEMAQRDARQTDVMISGCRFSTETFRRAFWFNGEILEMGTPRCDALANVETSQVEAIRRKLHIDSGTKVLLYAPTFRKNRGVDCYDVDFEWLMQSMGAGHCVVLVRLHPHLQHLSETFCQRNPNIVDVTKYDSLTDLLLVADVLVSDYSGLIFDYALTRKPCILYTPDLEQYCAKERGLYFDIKELPFPIAQNKEELAQRLEGFDLFQYEQDLDRFNQRIGNFENGDAGERIAMYLYNNYLK